MPRRESGVQFHGGRNLGNLEMPEPPVRDRTTPASARSATLNFNYRLDNRISPPDTQSAVMTSGTPQGSSSQTAPNNRRVGLSTNLSASLTRPALEAVHKQAISVSPAFILPALPPTRHHPYGRGVTPSCKTLWKTRGAVLARVFCDRNVECRPQPRRGVLCQERQIPICGTSCFPRYPHFYPQADTP